MNKVSQSKLQNVALKYHYSNDTALTSVTNLWAVFVNFRRLAVVEPGIVKHEPDVVNVLPWIGVLARV